MVERFSVGITASSLAKRYQVEEPQFLPRYNGAPTQLFPVITSDAPKGFSFFYWGVAPEWAKNKSIAERLINTRVEQLTERPVLKKALKKYRCLVPSDGFYAWKKVGKKTSIPWRVFPKDKSILSMAAIWEEYDDEQGNSFHTFSIFSQPAKGFAATITDRMPLFLTKDQEPVWLDREVGEEDLLKILQTEHDFDFDGFTVSPQLSNVAFDKPSLHLPMPAADQFGNLTLFG
ncbi:MAG: SOS response-associated peptidase [Bacteroidetes bacterium]|nr:SOS response-associated peptidase [Bacteroidota bacterium]